MLPPQQYLHMYKKFGLIPEVKETTTIPYSALVLAVYAIISPLRETRSQECTALTVRRKQGIFSINLKKSQNQLR